MIEYKNIKQVHLEISSLCNARCPLCPRNFKGYNYNDGYIERNLNLTDVQTIFSSEFLKQLQMIYINGNFGDIVMNPEGAEIVEYFKLTNPNLKIKISTNGSARNEEFWIKLGTNAEIDFCLDGLQDTHKLYRQNTDWNTIIKNAVTFISNKGIANWKFIVFDHNRHQIEQAKTLAYELGFNKFFTVDSKRNSGPVFDNHGNLIHVLGDYKDETSFPILFQRKKGNFFLKDLIKERNPKSNIKCQAKVKSEIYVTATGDVFPCCFTGFSPRTFGHGEYHQAINEQIKSLLPMNNNALTTHLQECIEWFNKIESSWKIETYEQGRLVICDDVCGFN